MKLNLLPNMIYLRKKCYVVSFMESFHLIFSTKNFKESMKIGVLSTESEFCLLKLDNVRFNSRKKQDDIELLLHRAYSSDLVLSD